MRLPGPTDVFKLTEQGFDAATKAIALVPRLVAIVSEGDVLLRRVTVLIGAMEKTQQRAAAAVDGVDALQVRIDGTLDRTTTVVERTEGVVGRSSHLVQLVEPLLDEFRPALIKLAPILARLVETTSPAEIDAVIKLVDALPTIVDKVDADILPVLDTLATVAPDLRDLLDVSKELNELIGSVPGLGRVKRKIEEKQELQDSYRADEVPPSAPDRRRNGDAESDDSATAGSVPVG